MVYREFLGNFIIGDIVITLFSIQKIYPILKNKNDSTHSGTEFVFLRRNIS